MNTLGLQFIVFMFLTRTSYLSPISAMFTGNDEQIWEATELALQKIWFLANVEVKDEDGHWCTGTILITNLQIVEPLLQPGRDSKARLSSVNIVTPGHINGSGNWHMERLCAVWQGHEMVDDEAIPTDIFETVSGKKYAAAFCNLSVEDLADGSTLKYQLPK